MTDLITLDKETINEIVATLPTEKRAAFAKAAKAAVKHLRDSKAEYAKAWPIACAMVENWWRLGLELQRMELGKGGRPTKTGSPGNQLTLGELGINKHQSARCQRLAEKSKAELDEWLNSKYDEEKYYLPSLRPAAEDGHVHVSENTGQPEWYTPPEFIESARKVLGSIDLDPASSEVAQENVKADTFYTVDDDGLSKDWRGNVWMNPPYTAGLIDQFMLKLKGHVEAGDVKTAITLTNNSTDTSWFQECAAAATGICLVSKRIRFLDESGEPSGAPLQGQALLYFGKAVKRFADRFSKHGSCWSKA